jgi:hypothetical protein
VLPLPSLVAAGSLTGCQTLIGLLRAGLVRAAAEPPP